MIAYGIVESEKDLKQILELQQANLPAAISAEEARQEGFVTVEHDLPLLRRMNSPYPHIVAKENGRIIGYALVMERKWANDIPILIPMFDEINHTRYNGQLLANCRYFVMGQICISKGYRGRGIFGGLYEEMKTRMKAHFEYIVTEISPENQRSLKAHFKAGFKNVRTYQSKDGAAWVIVLLNLS